MKRFFALTLILVTISGIAFGLYFIPGVSATITKWIGEDEENDPDMGPVHTTMSKEEFMMSRAENIAMLRGIQKDEPFDPQLRMNAVDELERKQARLARVSAPQAAWTPLGPAPIPNGQTLTVSTPVSGRTISIAVHPTNPNIVYVGAAQGGLYRSTDGGTNWTPLMDGALSLAIGAIAIAPSQPDTIYVGTGETGFCGDCFFGVGVYRIDNASTAAPVISGPFNDEAITDNDIFSGRGIGAIAVHPTQPGTIFVALGSGSGGSGGIAFSSLPNRGLYRSTDATSADPSFTKMAMTGTFSPNNATVDVVIDPGNPDLVICSVADALGNGDGGIYRSTNASVAVPTFTRTFVTNPANSNSRTELALHRSGGGVVTVYAASGTNGGTVQRSIDGGATWAQRIDNNFCTAQCFYDIGVAVDPTNADIMYIGGSPNLAFGRSTNGGTSFTSNATTAVGLHVDSHVIAVAPSLPTTIYFGSDGGIYKTTDSGTTWTPLNNSQYSATQFISLAVHPTDRYFTIGGTQDNGTNFFQPSQLWTNTEGGDGGFAQIDQNAVNNTSVTMYHTFFNQTNAMGYSRSLNAGNNWQLFGCGFGGATPNGMTCAVPAGGILFYAPMERGPGNPNTLYFGSNVLYRSANAGVTMVKVSQEGTMGGAISAIGISPQNDNVRIVGTSTGALFGTTTGANPLVDLDALGQIPNNFVGRAVVDPNNVNTAYVAIEVFGVNNVWKTTNLNAVNPTWTAVVSGLPQVPVNAFVIDPQDSNALYAGTDIGVYQSLDGGGSWLPFGTGLPRVAVFDAEINNVHRILRIATHGRGLFEIPIPGVGIPVPIPAGNGSSGPGGASALVAESCAVNNGAIDPGEVVTISYSITNVGGGPTTNLTGTLQATGGVLLSSGPQIQNYGAIPAGGTVTRNYTFTASGSCNGILTPSFQLQDGATNYGIVSTTYTLGALVTGAPALAENFDAVVAPALPAVWSTAQTGTAPLWATTTSFSDTAPNSAATDGVATPGDNSLTSPTIAIPAAPGVGTNPHVELTFRNNYNTEGGFDGGVLEISIAAGPFVDIITAGGTFTSGGYNGAIGVTDSVLTGRNAWTGNSNGFITTTVTLPPASHGQNAQLRWRTAYDTGTTPAGGGMRVDTLSIYTATRVCCGAPPPVADLAITKTDGVTTATPGGSVTYTITASNAGPGVVTDGVVTDTFPASLTCTTTSVAAGGATGNDAGPTAGNINDSGLNMPVGSSVTYTSSCNISAAATGSLSNTATVSSSATDSVPGNNSATDTDTLSASADLSITKTDGVTTATPGGSVTYTITASNAGPSNTTATVADTFPASLTANWTCVGAGGGTCTAGPVAGNINDAVTLPVGGSVTYTASASISAAATGTLSNTATVTGAATDPVPGNNSATDTDTLTAQANLGITKTDGVTTAVPGGSVTYTIVASNAGPSNTTATVADTFPASLTVTWTCAGAGGGTCTAAGAGNINDPVNLPVGGSVTYTASASISVNAAGSLSNTATVTGAATDPVPGNNSATDTDTLTPQANLAITKTDGVATAVPGGSVTYTITASNAGPSNAPGSNVTDNFPAAITGVNWTCVGAGGGTCTASGSGNINQTVNLPVGGSVTFTAVAAISAAATGTLANTATTATGVGVNDPTPGNNSATDTDTLTPQANLGITKTDGVTTVNPGGSTTYTITASNAGPSNAPGTTVADIFPAILTCTTTSVAAGGATGNAAGPFGGNINNTLNMPVGSSVTYTSVCNISGAASGTLTNTATVTAAIGVTDPTPGNNTATDADIIVVPPTISKNFTSPTIVFGEVTSLNIIVGNPATNVVNLTGVSFTDTLPAGITVPNLGPIALCGGSYSATAPNTVALTGATITPGTTCTATVAVTGVQIGPWTNTINSVSSTNGGTNNTPASAIITVNKASTTASVISDTPDPSVFGQNYTVGAQVIVTAPGSPTPTAPTGTITVTDGTNNCTITLSAASCLLPSTSVGAKTLTATYNGDGNFNASLASPGVPHTVNKANTATVMTSSANPSAFGQNVGFTATVSAAAPGAGTPTGTVTFAIDGVNQPPATLSGGSVTMNTSTLSVGTHTITAQYNGDANFNTSNGALAGGQVVGKANTTTVITNAAALASTASNSGQPYAVNFTVTPAVPGAGTPTGFVSVTDGTDICLGTVASGTCNLTSTTAGVKTITATYLGDPNFNSSSGTATHTVLASISGNIQQFVPPVANLAPEATTPLAGVTVSITGTAPLPASTTTDANGNYSFGGLTLGGNYTVTPTMAGKSFEPLSRSYTNVTANVTGADFVAYAPAVPREIKALNAYALQGQPAVMQLVLTGLGNEKTESFSLNFNINELSAPTVACGTSDAGCTIATDTSQPGKIGITVTPATQLAAGPRNIANVTFQTFASEPPNSPVTFGGAPTPQSITDAVGNPLQTAYTGAFAVFAKGFEGDVAPRPNGSGETDSSDIVGVSRFVAGLDNPVLLNTNEFQRADASPNGLKGDGKIDSTDIVQTTRYGAGLDGGTHVIVAGPMQALPLPPALTRAERSDEDREIARAKRTMRVGSVTAAPGSDVEVSVELDSRGDEVASSFTLNFDPARLRISGLSSPEANPDVAVGRDAPAGTGLAVNATNAARGQIGIVVFNANLIPFSNATGRKVVTLHFRIAEDAPTGPSPITFGDTDDSPTQRSLSDGNANPLKSSYTDGKVNIVGRNPAGVSGRGLVSILDGSKFRNEEVILTMPGLFGASTSSTTGSYRVNDDR